MKYIILLFTLAGLLSEANAQSFNREAKTEKGTSMLLGKINKEGLSSNAYGTWFQKNYDAFKPDAETIDNLKAQLEGYTITLFMGTWCGDSKREVPKFYKVLEEANFPLDRLTAIAVDRDAKNYKQSPGGEEEGLNIHRVPTFIFYKNGQEVNRIVERPVVSLEKDMLQILQGAYTPNYHGVSLTVKIMQEYGVEKFSKKKKKIQQELAGQVTHWKELNTYAYLLFQKGHREEANEIARLNMMLFPEESGAVTRLANQLKVMGALSEAGKYYKQALALDPDNKRLQEEVLAIENGSE